MTIRIALALAIAMSVHVTSAAEPAEPASTPMASLTPLPSPSLQKTIEVVRKSPIGAESNAATYLDLIGSGKATPAQVNDFAGYLAKRGMPRIGLEFQEYAVQLDETDATLWMNLGTIRRTMRTWGPSAAAFKRAIELDPTNAMAHYNLGAVYDADKDYEGAIEEYRRALVIDPELADPRKNPQVVNNDRLLAVKLQIYADQAGSISLPLLQMQKSEPKPPPVPAPDKK